MICLVQIWSHCLFPCSDRQHPVGDQWHARCKEHPKYELVLGTSMDSELIFRTPLLGSLDSLFKGGAPAFRRPPVLNCSTASMALHDLLYILTFFEEAFVEVLDGLPRCLGTTDAVSLWLCYLIYPSQSFQFFLHSDHTGLYFLQLLLVLFPWVLIHSRIINTDQFEEQRLGGDHSRFAIIQLSALQSFHDSQVVFVVG